jgi:hypothetical protein
MPDPTPPQWDLPVPREAVEDSAGASYWSVDECRWAGAGASVATEIADLLAPPVVVGTIPVAR